MKHRKTLLLGAAALIAARPLAARATQIVFDPTSYANAIQQLEQEVQMVNSLEQQIQNQLKELQGWGFSQLGAITQSMDRWQSALSAQTYGSTDPANQLNAQYPDAPAAYAGTRDAQIQQQDDSDDQEQRNDLIENRDVQNQVVQDLQPTADRMAEYVQKSNGAPGPTAAMQAGNEELATVAAQAQALQALEIADAHADADEQARLQAEDAYATEQGRLVIQRGDTQATNAVPDPFPLANQ